VACRPRLRSLQLWGLWEVEQANQALTGMGITIGGIVVSQP
jgi:hypothetical protein